MTRELLYALRTCIPYNWVLDSEAGDAETEKKNRSILGVLVIFTGNLIFPSSDSSKLWPQDQFPLVPGRF